MSGFGIGAIRSPAGTFFRRKERGIGPCLRVVSVCCGIAIAWCARAAETGDGRAVVEDPGEKSLPMSLTQVPTGVAGLTVHRIAYATAGGAVRSLLILVADSHATLSRRVRVGEANAFRWHADWFVPLGAPVLDQSGAP